MRCSCSKLHLKCNDQCQCDQCDNPLNVLAVAGKNLADVLGDECLMHNVFKVSCSSLAAVYITV